MSVEVLTPRLLPATRTIPALEVTARAFLPCGCSVYVGHRIDDGGDPALAGVPCSIAHEHPMARVMSDYRVSLDDPRSAAAVDVADELLDVHRWDFDSGSPCAQPARAP